MNPLIYIKPNIYDFIISKTLNAGYYPPVIKLKTTNLSGHSWYLTQLKLASKVMVLSILEMCLNFPFFIGGVLANGRKQDIFHIFRHWLKSCFVCLKTERRKDPELLQRTHLSRLVTGLCYWDIVQPKKLSNEYQPRRFCGVLANLRYCIAATGLALLLKLNSNC